MKIEDYNEYYIQGSDHYLIPKDVFKELFNEMINWKEEVKELKKQLEELKQEKQEWINLLDMFKNQQKEFMNFLTEAINKLKLKQKTSNSAILKANIDLQVEVYSIVLSKYKEIIGDDK